MCWDEYRELSDWDVESILTHLKGEFQSFEERLRKKDKSLSRCKHKLQVANRKIKELEEQIKHYVA